jgi:hypothetical protein
VAVLIRPFTLLPIFLIYLQALHVLHVQSQVFLLAYVVLIPLEISLAKIWAMELDGLI